MTERIELVDLVDASGEIQAVAVPLNETRSRYPELHLQIAIAVIFDGTERVLTERRALSKKSDSGYIDHVCGVVSSGENPQDTASRESVEETTIVPETLELVARGVNSYNRYRYLYVGTTDETPDPARLDPKEVKWAKFVKLQQLKAWRDSGKYQFVGEFFEDHALAEAARTTTN